MCTLNLLLYCKHTHTLRLSCSAVAEFKRNNSNVKLRVEKTYLCMICKAYRFVETLNNWYCTNMYRYSDGQMRFSAKNGKAQLTQPNREIMNVELLIGESDVQRFYSGKCSDCKKDIYIRNADSPNKCIACSTKSNLVARIQANTQKTVQTAMSKELSTLPISVKTERKEVINLNADSDDEPIPELEDFSSDEEEITDVSH